jgi:hypothetical protein
MRHWILSLLIVILPAVAPASTLRTWEFRVLLDGREIGAHRFALSEVDGVQELSSEARFDVRFLFINAWRYRHMARERWQGDCLQAIESRTDTNGELEQVNGSRRGERLVVERTGARDEHAGCVMTFAYWNPRILAAERLLNSQTGELLPVTFRLQGQETISVRGRPRVAERHHLSAPGLRIDLWYADGEWLALESDAPGGRRLRYELR